MLYLYSFLFILDLNFQPFGFIIVHIIIIISTPDQNTIKGIIKTANQLQVIMFSNFKASSINANPNNCNNPILIFTLIFYS